MQQPLGAPGPRHVVLQPLGIHSVQERECFDKVRLPRSVRSNQHIDGRQLELLDGCDALETLDCDVAQHGKVELPFSLAAKLLSRIGRLASEPCTLFVDSSATADLYQFLYSA